MALIGNYANGASNEQVSKGTIFKLLVACQIKDVGLD